jgi:hypothetical protein
MKILIAALAVLLAAHAASAAICTVMGYVNYADGSNASGVNVIISNLDYNTTYTTISGGKDYPVRNFYMQSLTCEPNDRLVVSAPGFQEELVFDHYPLKLNITVAGHAPNEESPSKPAVHSTFLQFAVTLAFVLLTALFMKLDLKVER